MAKRRRLGVMLEITGDPGSEIDGLRRALGDTQLGRIDPHVTLVPPINVAEDDLATVVGVVEGAAASVDGPLELDLGPPSSFLPHNATLYLAVEPRGAPDVVADLADRCRVGPLERPPDHDFIPHVTISIRHPAERVPEALVLLGAYRRRVVVEAVTVMELQHRDGADRWTPIATPLIGGRSRVAAGALDLVLTTSTLLDPATAASLGPFASDPSEALGRGGGDGLVVVARTHDDHRVVGFAAGRRRGRRAGVLRHVIVASDDRGQGVARRLVAAWEREAERGGARRIVAPTVSDVTEGLLTHLGWGRTEPILERRLDAD